MGIVYIILLSLILFAGVIMILFALPGTFVIVGATFFYGLLTGFETVALPFIGVLLVISVMLEMMEELLGAAMARRFGGSRWAMVGAVIGGFSGALAGTSAAPLAGTLLGGFIGVFCGAMAFEGLKTGDWHRASKVGLGALIGAVTGKITKILVATGMVIAVLVKVL